MDGSQALDDDVVYHEDGTCYMECPQLVKNPIMLLGYENANIAFRKCKKFNLPMAQSLSYCPVWARRMAVECEAWRSGLLERGLCIEGFMGDHIFDRCYFVQGIPFNTITEATDALMAEKEE